MKKIFFFLLLLLPLILLSQIPEQPSIGDGSAGSPYEISTLGHLAWLSDPANSGEWSQHFIQTANINASETATWNGGLGFSPIGIGLSFTGSYNGNYYTITGLTINRPGQNHIGFFSSNDGALSGIVLLNTSVVCGNHSGSLFGINAGSISECSSSGNVSGEGLILGSIGGGGFGGLCASTSVISKCTSSCTVIMDEIGWGGAFIGYYRGTLVDSYCNGSIAKSDGTPYPAFGGLSGYNDNGTITNCYSSAVVNAGVNTNGGVIPYSSGTCNSSFWDITTSGQTGSACGTGLTTAQMGDPANFIGWDFTNTWVMSGAKDGYPQLQWEANIGGGTATPLNVNWLWLIPVLFLGVFGIRRLRFCM
ncbi:MAG: hypothetical protein C0593_02550 [Marinilabiliales bacterium]|nr:MAG: hypothetical protein C0593_02550 [Marinilabiliales bacterium]